MGRRNRGLIEWRGLLFRFQLKPVRFARLAAILLLSACGGEEMEPCLPCYLPADSPENALTNIQISYRSRDILGYSEILADDFRFYLNDATRQDDGDLPESWNRSRDVSITRRMFTSPEVVDIRAGLSFSAPRVIHEPGREGWILFEVAEPLVEVELGPSPVRPEGLVLRVENQVQEFYFRKGRTPRDSTSGTWYLAEWRDIGNQAKAVPDRDMAAIRNISWSGIKVLFSH